MRNARRVFALLLLIVSVVAIPTASRSAQLPVSYLKTSVKAGVSAPGTLSPTHPSDVAVRLGISSGTTDGSSPPSLRTVETSFDRQLRRNDPNVPQCRHAANKSASRLASTCPDSLVGEGKINVLVGWPESSPINLDAELAAYEGGRRGGATILWLAGRFSAPMPGPRELIIPVIVRNADDSGFGSAVSLALPTFADGYGHVTRLALSFHRGLFSATCKEALQFRTRMRFVDGEFLQDSAAQQCPERIGETPGATGPLVVPGRPFAEHQNDCGPEPRRFWKDVFWNH